jgi:hypothetical protein
LVSLRDFDSLRISPLLSAIVSELIGAHDFSVFTADFDVRECAVSLLPPGFLDEDLGGSSPGA